MTCCSTPHPQSVSSRISTALSRTGSIIVLNPAATPADVQSQGLSGLTISSRVGNVGGVTGYYLYKVNVWGMGGRGEGYRLLSNQGKCRWEEALSVQMIVMISIKLSTINSGIKPRLIFCW